MQNALHMTSSVKRVLTASLLIFAFLSSVSPFPSFSHRIFKPSSSAASFTPPPIELLNQLEESESRWSTAATPQYLHKFRPCPTSAGMRHRIVKYPKALSRYAGFSVLPSSSYAKSTLGSIRLSEP